MAEILSVQFQFAFDTADSPVCVKWSFELLQLFAFLVIWQKKTKQEI